MRKVNSVSGHAVFQRFLFLIAIGTFIIVSPSFAMAKDVIGVVDVLKTFQNTDLGKSIQAHLSRFQKKRGDEIQGERKQLQEEQKQIEQQVGVISKDALKAKEVAFQQKVQAYQKKLQKIQTQVASENAVEIRKFLDALSHASETLGKKFGFQIIFSQHPIRIPMGPYPPPFQSSRLLYMNPKVDLTQSVIQYINKHNSPGGTGE
jgi:outer membrane protein